MKEFKKTLAELLAAWTAVAVVVAVMVAWDKATAFWKDCKKRKEKRKKERKRKEKYFSA